MKKNMHAEVIPTVDVLLKGEPLDANNPANGTVYSGVVRDHKKRETTKFIVIPDGRQPVGDGWHMVEVTEVLEERNQHGYSEVACRVVAMLPDFRKEGEVRFEWSQREGAWQGRVRTDEGITLVLSLIQSDEVHMGAKHPANRPVRKVAIVQQRYRTPDGTFRVVLCELVLSDRARRRHGEQPRPKAQKQAKQPKVAKPAPVVEAPATSPAPESAPATETAPVVTPEVAAGQPTA